LFGNDANESGALSYDGTNDITSQGDRANFKESPMSMYVEFQVDDVPSKRLNEDTMFIRKHLTADPWEQWTIRLRGAADADQDKIQFAWRGTGGNKTIFSNNIVETGRKYKVICTVDSSFNMKMYVDGILQDDTDTASADYTSDPGNLTFGASTGSTHRLDGKMYDIKFWSGKALSAAEVIDVINGKSVSGLTDWWPHKDGTGSTLTDSMGVHDGTITGATWVPRSKTGTHANRSMIFDGASGNVTVPSDASIDISNLTAFSYEALIKPIGVGEGNFGRIIDKNNHELFTRDLSSGAVRFQMKIDFGGGTDSVVRTDTRYDLGDWHHVVFVYNAGGDDKGQVYVNGVEPVYDDQTAGSGTKNSDTSSDLVIANSSGDDRTFDGQHALSRFYDRGLSAQEVRQRYEWTKQKYGFFNN